MAEIKKEISRFGIMKNAVFSGQMRDGKYRMEVPRGKRFYFRNPGGRFAVLFSPKETTKLPTSAESNGSKK